MGSGDPVTILVVDDNPQNIDVVIGMLDPTKFDVIVARSGERAIERVARRRPDIVLLDVKMPGIDGFEVCRRLKTDRDLADVPIIFMTALSDDESKRRAFEIGGADFITKPIQRGELEGRIANHVEIARYRNFLQAEIQRRNRELVELANEQTLLLDTMDAHVWYLTDKGTYGKVNRAHALFLGRTADSLVGLRMEDVLPAGVARALTDSMKSVLYTGVEAVSEEWVPNRDGEMRLFSIRQTPERSQTEKARSIVCVAIDVTETYTLRKEVEQQLHAREILLQEVHHRVKNNLNVMVSLLNLELNEVEAGADAVVALRSSTERIYAMAEVHQQIFDSPDVSALSFPDYVTNLVQYLRRSYDPGGRVSVSMDIDVFEITATVAIPLGMIVGELFSRGVFDLSRAEGEFSLSVSSHTENDGTIQLCIEYDAPNTVSNESWSTSLSHTLVDALSQQIDATLRVENSNRRVRYELSVPHARPLTEAQNERTRSVLH